MSNHPLPEDLLRKIERKAEKIYDDLDETVRDYEFGLPFWPKKEIQPIIEGIAPYALKLDIAMKALDDIRDVGDIMAMDIARIALQQIKQLDNEQ